MALIRPIPVSGLHLDMIGFFDATTAKLSNPNTFTYQAGNNNATLEGVTLTRNTSTGSHTLTCTFNCTIREADNFNTVINITANTPYTFTASQPLFYLYK